MQTPLRELPDLGAGLGFRSQLADVIDDRHIELDWLEIMTEEFLGNAKAVDALRGRFRLVPHGVEASVGGPDELDNDYIDAIAALVDRIQAPWFSDHLCFTRAGGRNLGTLMPLPRNTATARRAARRAQTIQRRVGVPFLVENISYHLNLDDGLTEAEFIAEFLDACECGLLLDVTNLFANAANHGYDPVKFLDTIPAERVVQIHLAGIERSGQVVLDTHSKPVPPDVWELFALTLERVRPRGVLIERDSEFDQPAEIVADVTKAREYLQRVSGE